MTPSPTTNVQPGFSSSGANCPWVEGIMMQDAPPWPDKERHTTAGPAVKKVRRGFRGPMIPKRCGVMFEFVPAWLWVIRLSEFSQIHMTESDLQRLKQDFESTWEQFKDKVHIVGRSSSTSCVDLWFLSGSRTFLEWSAGHLPEQIPILSWLYPSGRRKPTNLASMSSMWVSIGHSQVGGATNISGMFGLRHLSPFQLEADQITRTIEHIIKHSERPAPCDPESLGPLATYYRLGDRLSAHHLGRQVLLPSTFSRTGWGLRSLLPSELGHAYDLPSFVPWDVSFPGTLVPLQLLRTMMDHALSSLEADARRRHDAVEEETSQCLARVCPVDTPPVLIDAVFLPSLGKWLSGSWADAPIASKAVKADNARIDVSPWHQRIALVLPCSSRDIARIEELCLRLWRRRLVVSFRQYLVSTYGRDWAHRAWEHRLACVGSRRTAGVASVADYSRMLAKRARMGETCHKRGVTAGEMGEGIRTGWDREVVKEEGPERDLEMGNVGELIQDLDLGRAVLRQLLSCLWWDWTNGSSLIFWRWNGPEQIRAARDGMQIFIQSPLPRGRKLARLNLDVVQKRLVAEKLDGMRAKSYLEPGFVSNALHFFAVPKGDHDIRVVFDGTSSGLNDTLWSPNFYLPSARAAALNISYSSWMSDMDCGEMFHNFFMDKRVRKCAGLRVDRISAPVRADQIERIVEGGTGGEGQSSYLRWTRLFMGMRPSPYISVRHYYWAEEFAKGNPALADNPMAFDKVILNLPGMLLYDPTLPKVMKWNTAAKAIAGDVITFVDDVRVTGYSKENCRDVHRQFASKIQYLGMQDAPRKYRPPSQTQAGAWTGTIFQITKDSISKSVSPEKWEKGKEMLRCLQEALESHVDKRPQLDRKALERETGFLNHLSMTFEIMVPYLKGFYLTLNSWRQGRDADDWKVSDKQWQQILLDRFHAGTISPAELEEGSVPNSSGSASGPPPKVTASPRLADDVESLMAIFGSSDDPPQVNLRSKRILTVIYGFGDASGSGLGSTFTCGLGFTFRIGVWGAREHPESSNWKEFTNVVEALEEEGEAGNLNNAEVFMFTDNSTVEACAEKGSSSSKKLLRLIVRLHSLSTRLGVRIHIFHVAGTRMIAQGTDGVSRGYLAQGVMAGDSMKVHIPIYLSAVERSSTDLVPWIRSWTDTNAILLEPLGWFETGHDIEGWNQCSVDGCARPTLGSGQTYIWTPPPFAAEVAMAELRKARIKRQRSSHIFVCPRLCTTLWQRQLYKCADFVFELPVGSSVWPHSMHEPLLIGVLFPFLSVKPWQLRGTPKMHLVGRELRKVLQTPELDPRDLLRKFWRSSLGLRDMPERVVRRMLFFD